MGKDAGEAVGVVDEDDIGPAVADSLTQALQSRPAEVASGVAIVGEAVTFAVTDDGVAAVGCSLPQPDHLSLDAVFLRLVLGADPGVEDDPWP